MNKIKFSTENIEFFEGENTKEFIFKNVSEILLKQGVVDYNFYENILGREKIYPTGLKLNNINIAIPHTDVKYVKEDTIFLAIVDKGIDFNVMDNPNELINVKIIFFLALSQPHSHIDILMKIMEFIKNEYYLEKIYNVKDKNKICDLIEKEIINN